VEQERSERGLIVLDMINEKAHPNGLKFEPMVREIIPFIKGELAYFRQRMRPVIFCNSLSIFYPDEPIDVVEFNANIISDLIPRAHEICMKKTRSNAFFKTELFNLLTHLKVRSLTIVGAFTHTSILTTTASALDYGFHVVVPETCVCSPDPQYHSQALSLMRAWGLG